MTSPAIMPRIVIVWAWLAAACVFDADYRGGTYRCSDGVCPSGLRCEAGACTSMSPVDAGADAAHDSHVAALTCADPGEAGSAASSTAGRGNTVSASCGGFVMNGPDAVYRVTANAGQHVMVSVTGRQAYLIAPCTLAPQTPACIGNALASAGNPISVVAPASGSQFVIVDDSNAAASGAYTLEISVGP
jgi:hypothetical protein